MCMKLRKRLKLGTKTNPTLSDKTVKRGVCVYNCQTLAADDPSYSQ